MVQSGEKDHIAINLRTKNTDLNNTSNGTNLIEIQEKKVAGTKILLFRQINGIILYLR